MSSRKLNIFPTLIEYFDILYKIDNEFNVTQDKLELLLSPEYKAVGSSVELDESLKYLAANIINLDPYITFEIIIKDFLNKFDNKIVSGTKIDFANVTYIEFISKLSILNTVKSITGGTITSVNNVIENFFNDLDFPILSDFNDTYIYNKFLDYQITNNYRSLRVDGVEFIKEALKELVGGKFNNFSKNLMNYIKIRIFSLDVDSGSLEDFINHNLSKFDNKDFFNPIKIVFDCEKFFNLFSSTYRDIFINYLKHKFINDADYHTVLSTPFADYKNHAYKIIDNYQELLDKPVSDFSSYFPSKKDDKEYIEVDATELQEYEDKVGKKFKWETIEKYLDTFTDVWRMQKNRTLFTRLNLDEINKDSNDELKISAIMADGFKEYTDQKKDEVDIKKGKFKCTALFGFKNSKECTRLFELIKKKDDVTFEQLVKWINSNIFDNGFENLINNIVKVNPVYIYIVLKAFDFEIVDSKYKDGTKLTFETFANWWKRTEDKITKISGGLTPPLHKLKRYNDVVIEPPAKLTLFLKLLLTVINNNETILNPYDGDVTKLTIKPVYDYSLFDSEYLEIIDIKTKKKYKTINALYKNKKNTSCDIADKYGELKKHETYLPPTVSPLIHWLALATNTFYTNLALVNVDTQIPGYPGFSWSGGGVDVVDDDDTETKKNKDFKKNLCHYASIAWDAFEIFTEFLREKNKKIDSAFKNKYMKDVDALSKQEQKLYKIVDDMSKYQRIINIVNDKEETGDVSDATMEKLINKYTKIHKRLGDEIDGLTIELLRQKELVSEKLIAP
jgi:hypothetical protein